MKKIISSLILVSLLALFGCMSLPEKADYYLKNLRNTKHAVEITVNVPYLKVYDSTIIVFKDLGVNILKKDFEGKVIFASFYPKQYLNHYAVFFDDLAGRTRIVLKATGFLLNEHVLLQKIKEESEHKT